MKIGELYKAADWKLEKHAPVIEVADTVKAGESVAIELSVGKEIAHPNTTEHHVSWIKLYFVPEGSKAVYEVASLDFNVHGESPEGANQGPVYAEPFGVVCTKFQKSGTLIATSYCNIHGLWESEKQITVE